MNQNGRSPRGKVKYSEAAERGFAELDALVADVEREVQAWRGWQLLKDPGRQTELHLVLREILHAVHMYQGHTTEAGFRMIGRLPKSEVRLMQVLSHHKAEEAEHGLWAWADYLAMGGNPALHDAPPSPAAFAVAAVWDRMADCCDPFGYIGAEYLFENLTERLTKAIGVLPGAAVAFAKGTRFLSDHVTEDVRHANLFRHLIKQVLTERPDAIGPMTECLLLFRQVYPIPLWDEAFVRAIGATAGRLAA
jgi:hypothetical protein